jgi:hypothetical protein
MAIEIAVLALALLLVATPDVVLGNPALVEELRELLIVLSRRWPKLAVAVSRIKLSDRSDLSIDGQSPFL